MQLPEELRQAIEALAESHNYKQIKQAQKSVSDNYRRGERSSFKEADALFSYLVTRMPATFAACSAVFQEIQERLPTFSPATLLDLGAGPGTATWAALQTFSSLQKLHLVEQEKGAIEMGKKLAPHWVAEWHHSSLEHFSPPPVDLAVLSYVFAETFDLTILDRLRDIPVVAIIEPGTPLGFARIRAMRQHVLPKNAHLIAPCPHSQKCPMSGNDWCHFAARVERTRLHRLLKEGTLGFEDEKYSYLVYSPTLTIAPIQGRVIRHPQKGSGHVRLALCASDGSLKQQIVTKSKKSSYHSARDAVWGSAWI